jgi:lipopolysaccharide transport system permease protein
MNTTTKNNWDWEIQSKTSWWGSSFKDLWSYRHLLTGLVRRDFLLSYQQTALGPIWMLFQPLLTMVTYVLVFGKLIGVSTGGLPPVLFYMSGVILWNFFNDTFLGTSFTFKENAQIFSKVYFPRLIMPLSQLSTHFFRFLVQFSMFLALIAFYVLFQDYPLPGSLWILSLPLVFLLVGLTALSLGLIFSVLTAKYRDMINLVSLGVRLLMFLTPVLYPVQFVPEKARWMVQFNPLTSYFELFRLSLLGEGVVTTGHLVYSIAFTLFLFSCSLLIFNKKGDKLIDIV